MANDAVRLLTKLIESKMQKSRTDEPQTSLVVREFMTLAALHGLKTDGNRLLYGDFQYSVLMGWIKDSVYGKMQNLGLDAQHSKLVDKLKHWHAQGNPIP